MIKFWSQKLIEISKIIYIVEEQEEREWKNNTHSISVFLEQQNQGFVEKEENDEIEIINWIFRGEVSKKRNGARKSWNAKVWEK